MPGNVLFLAHDGDLRESLCIGVEDAGYTCIRAANATEALRWLADHSAPSILVLADLHDFSTPDAGTNGAGLLRALNADETFWQSHRVMLLTPLPQQLVSDVAAIAAARGLPVVAMPYDLTYLIDLVDEFARALAVSHPDDTTNGTAGE